MTEIRGAETVTTASRLKDAKPETTLFTPIDETSFGATKGTRLNALILLTVHPSAHILFWQCSG